MSGKSGAPGKGRGPRGRRLWTALLIVLAVCFAFSAVRLIRYYASARATEDRVTELKASLPSEAPPPTPDEGAETEPPDAPEEPVYELSERYKTLYERNGELAGWVTIEDTRVDYPVMLSPEEPEYYLSHSFDREPDVNGLPFLDSRCAIAPKSPVQIVYGHNMRSGVMFHDLTLYEDEEFWRGHQYIAYDTLYERSVYQIVAAFVFDAYSADPQGFQFHRYTEFPSVKKFDAFKSHVQELALYDTGLDYGFEDQYLILATCEYSAANGRFVLLAKRVEQ